MSYKEQKLQQQCVAWFRAQYPHYAMLLTHPINEGGRNTRVSGAIHKSEGTVAGVADLLLFLPSFYKGQMFGCLGIEMKTEDGRQSQSQKDFERMFSAAQNCYVVVRNFDEFRTVITRWIGNIPADIVKSVVITHAGLSWEQKERDIKKFKSLINKK